MEHTRGTNRVPLSLILLIVALPSFAAAAADGLTRTISVSSASFIRDPDSTGILMDNEIALRWAAGSDDQAGVYLSRPADWDGLTPVKVHIYFALGGSGAGSVNWRLKLNHYTPGSGEWLTNPATRDSDTLLSFADGPSWYRVYSQTFTLDASAFNAEPLWSLFFLRGTQGNGENFGGYLYVLSAGIEYAVAASPPRAVVIPLVD